MTFSENNEFWLGAFTPIQKHRYHPKTRHPEHLVNHIEIRDLTLLDEDEIEAYDEDFENDYSYDQLTQLGDGPVHYLARVGFVGDGRDKYDYILHLSDEEDEKKLEREAKEIIAADLTPR